MNEENQTEPEPGYDAIQARLNEAQWLLKDCRAILNMCGYYDAVDTIDSFLGRQE